jgi:shikimate dehydrogenase
MQESAARALGIELRYERFAVQPEDLAEAVAREHSGRIDGYNLTVPHKESILSLLDEVDATARAIGAVNTVVRRGERYIGYNTDAPGFVRSLEEAGLSASGARVVVLGAGGAARAAVLGLANAGASQISVLSRRPEQSQALCDSLVPHVACELVAAPLSEARDAFESAILLVQASSATLDSNPGAQAFADSLPMEALSHGAAVVDMVYEPLETAVLAKARSLGLGVLDGLGMLVHQGAIAFEMWTGFEPPLEVMRAALED